VKISRRTIGKAMIAIGVMGIVVGVTSVIVGQTLVRQVQDSVDDSLVVTSEALDAVNDSITLTGTLVETVRAGVDSVGETVAAVRTSIDQSSTAVEDTTTFLGGSLPDSLDAVSDVLPTIESIASSIDDALRVASRAPFGPDYDPAAPFDDAIAQLSTAIDPLPEQLRTLAGDFTELNTSTADVSTQLGALETDITDLNTQLDQVGGLIDRYKTTAADAQALARQSRRDLDSSATSTRALMIVLGLVFALGQIVPIWLGTVLLGSTPVHRLITRKADDEQRPTEVFEFSPPSDDDIRPD
jgi:methyl-accepting chemotaxis protein